MHRAWVLAAIGVLAAACSPRSPAPGASHPGASSTCPACECKCECEPGQAGFDPYERDELLAAATRKAGKGDGAGCLADLDRAKAIDGRPRVDSENAESPYAHMRAQCLMLAGQCDAGKQLARKALDNGMLARWGPEQIEKSVEAHAAMYCRGRMSDRDALLQSLMELQHGAYMTRKDVRFCDSHYERVKRLRTRVKPRNEDDTQVIHLDPSLVSLVPACYQRAGDCKKAWSAYQETVQHAHSHVYAKMDPRTRQQALRTGFDAMISKCKGQG